MKRSVIVAVVFVVCMFFFLTITVMPCMSLMPLLEVKVHKDASLMLLRDP